MAKQNRLNERNIILRIHPLQRMLISLVPTIIVFFTMFKKDLPPLFIITLLWDVFAFAYLVINWIVLYTRRQEDIVKIANTDDGSRIFVLISILITSLASMFAVGILLMVPTKGDKTGMLELPVAVLGMMLSWATVHTLFTFHYAHMFYDKTLHNNKQTPNLLFPDDIQPAYLDFAYFSFVIGMTFQVSDVEIASSKIRRTVLAHSLLAFILNTFVVALTINLVAGATK